MARPPAVCRISPSRARDGPAHDALARFVTPQVPCGDGTLTVEALSLEIMRRYANLKQVGRPAMVYKLEDAHGASLFFEDRVCDVLENRARVRARRALAWSAGDPVPGAARPSSGKRKRETTAYERDDAMFEYVTPSSVDLLQNNVPKELNFACPVCEGSFAQPQQLQFHIRSHNTSKMTAAQRATVDAAIHHMDDRSSSIGSTRSRRKCGSDGARTSADGVKKTRRFFCPNPSCEHNPEVEPGAHPFVSFKLCRQHYMRRHSAERPYACPKCRKAYAVKADMQTHAKRCGSSMDT